MEKGTVVNFTLANISLMDFGIEYGMQLTLINRMTESCQVTIIGQTTDVQYDIVFNDIVDDDGGAIVIEQLCNIHLVDIEDDIQHDVVLPSIEPQIDHYEVYDIDQKIDDVKTYINKMIEISARQKTIMTKDLVNILNKN